MLTQQDRDDIEEIVKRHKGESDAGCLLVLFILFLMGFFKSCGY